MKQGILIFLILGILAACDADPEKQSAPLLKTLNITLMRESAFAAGTAIVDIACDNVYGTGAAHDWEMSNVSLTSTASIIQNKACRITLVSYSDGVDTYVPVDPGSPLVISIASNGAVSQSSAVRYSNEASTPVFQWFGGFQGVSLYTVIINFAGDAVSVNNLSAPTSLLGQVVTLGMAGVVAPVVSSLSVFGLPALNAALASFTLVADVSGATACKYIDNSG